MSRILVNLVVCLCLSLAASAAVIPLEGLGSDNQVKGDGSMPWVGGGEFRVGMGDAQPSAGVFVFELPVLPVGETVASADLAFSVVGGNNWSILFENGMDLYGVRMSSSSTVVATDYYRGAFGGDAAATAIQDYIVYESQKLGQAAPGEVGRHDTEAAAETALGAWVQTMYDSPEYNMAGPNYVFVRLNDRGLFTNTTRYWSVATGNATTVENRPVLTLTTVPEPTTLALLALGLVAEMRRRRA